MQEKHNENNTEKPVNTEDQNISEKSTVSGGSESNEAASAEVSDATAADKASDNGNKSPSAEKESKKETAKLKNECKKLSDELEKETKEREELSSKYYNMLAEYDNYRKRSQKERDGIYTAAYAEALSEFLPMVDNIERALAYKGTENFTKGIELIAAQFTETLKKLGIEAYGQRGDVFDPNIHNAVMRTEDETLGENTIAEVLMKGYSRDGKIIRHAMVKVAN